LSVAVSGDACAATSVAQKSVNRPARLTLPSIGTLRFQGELKQDRLFLFQHDFGGFDDGRDGVADLEPHFLGAPFGNDAFNEVVAHANDYMSHNTAELKFDDLSFETITGRESYAQRILLGFPSVYQFSLRMQEVEGFAECLLARFRYQANFEDSRPEFAGDEQALVHRIVGDAVEDGAAVTAIHGV
jgi:hypothetical protein